MSFMSIAYHLTREAAIDAQSLIFVSGLQNTARIIAGKARGNLDTPSTTVVTPFSILHLISEDKSTLHFSDGAGI